MSSNPETTSSQATSAPSSLAPNLCPVVPRRAAASSPAPVVVAEASPAPPPATRRRKISRRDLANLTSQLAIMMRSGVDVATALESIARQSKKAEQKAVVRAIHDDVLAGQSFSAALAPFQQMFGPSYVATVAAGEASGKMAEILNQLARLLRAELRLRNNIRMLMAYPVLLMAVSLVVTSALVLFVLPRFAEIFAQFDTPLPVLTRMLLSVASELRSRYWLWGPLMLTLAGGAAMFRFSALGRRWWDTLMLKVVLIGEVTRMLLMGRVCRLLGLMLESGVPLLQSLRIVRTSVGNSLYKELLCDLEEDVVNGQGIGDALAGSTIIPGSAVEMLLTAEKTGNLGSVTRLMGEHFEEEAETRLRDIVTLVEPLITIGMGVVVAIVVAAVMLPMFDMATFAQG